MRWVIWILGLFACAVALALALRLNTGYALLVSPPYRIELSLNLLLLLLAVAFAAFYLLLRFIIGALGLPAKVREFRWRRRRESARRALNEAQQAFFEGRYGRAEKAAAEALAAGEAPALGAVVAARAAHELRRFDERDGYLARAEELAPEAAAMRIIATAGMLLDQHRHQDALLALKALPAKHTGALRLELKAHQQAGNWEQALALIDQLERRGGLDALQADQFRRHAGAENLRRKAHDRHALDECWQKVPARDRRNPRLAAIAAQCFAGAGADAQAQQIIEQALEVEWDSDLVALYADCGAAAAIGRIERAEGWLSVHPRDAVLLLVLGRLCIQQELWGKAQSYLEASLAIEATYSAQLALAQLQERLGNADAAQRHYRASLELAGTQLKQQAGGRRRMHI